MGTWLITAHETHFYAWPRLMGLHGDGDSVMAAAAALPQQQRRLY